MYLKFYGFTDEPFRITPDPGYLFLSPSHKEALASIVYGIKMRKGFVGVVGEVGTGKTTIIRSCLARVNRNRARVVYIFNPNVTFPDLLRLIFQELEITPESDDVNWMVQQLQRFLIEEFRSGRFVILMIDEAQNMPVETLESLRVLSNLETTRSKLIQIIMVGQPELVRKMNLQELRQLRQRVAVRAVIRPLSPHESVEYIHHRLSIAGAEKHDSIFTAEGLNLIARHSNGIPRMINTLCDNALVAGYGFQEKPVTTATTERVIVGFSGEGPKELRWVAV